MENLMSFKYFTEYVRFSIRKISLSLDNGRLNCFHSSVQIYVKSSTPCSDHGTHIS